MFKSKFAKVFVLSICITAISTSIAFASTGGGQSVAGQFVVAQPTEVPKVILEEQHKIDQYLFEDHRKEIEQKGFMVTNTGPMQDYVEVGISPYNEENANYLYEVFGRDKIKVVEGQHARVFNTTDNAAANVTVTSKELASSEQAQAGLSTSPLIYGAGVVVLLGGIAIATRKLKIVKR